MIEAIYRFERVRNGGSFSILYPSDIDDAIAALRAQSEDNPPLTLDELRGMDGEPVYISYPKNHCNDRWVISDGWDAEFNEFCSADGSEWSDYDYSKTWIAYRRKPEGREP